MISGAPASDATLEDSTVLVMAVAVTLAALLALPLPWQVPAVGGVFAWRTRRPWMLVVCLALCASGLAASALTGLNVEPGSFDGTVTVVRDGVLGPGGVLVEVRTAGHHFNLVGPTSARGRLESATAGDRLLIHGRIAPGDARSGYVRWRHVAGTLRATRVSMGGRPRLHWRVANGVRHAVASLGAPLEPAARALFNGFVLGDAGGQKPVDEADFQGAGLTHLLVASGENVAFLLTLVAPVLQRSRLRTRWLITLVLLMAFVLVTRFEPSVLRAAVMAAVTATGASLGRPVAARRSLALAITALVLADPFLVHSVAFALSVSASIGVLMLTRPIEALLGGPSGLRTALAVTVAAQLGVGPVLIATFGGIPVATLPANVLAAPAAAMVVVLGLPCLMIAALPLPGAVLFAWAPRVLLGWISGVAHIGAALPLGSLGPWTWAGAAACVGSALGFRFFGHTWGRRVTLSCAGVACLIPALGLVLATGPSDPMSGVHVVHTRAATVVVITRSVDTVDALGALSGVGVRRIDTIVMPHGDESDRALVRAIEHRFIVARVVVPPHAQWPGAIQVRSGQRLWCANIVIDVVLDDPVLSVDARPADSG